MSKRAHVNRDNNSVTVTTTITRDMIPDKLVDDLKKFNGLPPYSGFNPCQGDGYFAAAMVREFGDDLIFAANKLVIEPMKSRYESAMRQLEREFA